MKQALKFSLHLVGAMACLAAGIWASSLLRGDAAPAYFEGDFSALRRQTGTQIVLFSTSTCSHCRAAREFLRREHIHYTDFVINQSADAQARFRALGGDVVPLILIGDQAVRGFREDLIRQALAKLADKPAA